MQAQATPDVSPPAGSLQRWAYDYVMTDVLALKLAPPAAPEGFASFLTPLRLAAPGRPPELRVSGQKSKTRGSQALRDPRRRAALIHTFLHHELQAAELMCWALLAFPDAPDAFKRGLMGICQDELRHMGMYAAHLEHLGFRVGDFPVRDWFWQRVPGALTATAFVAVMGLGFEAGNLDHTQRFAAQFRAVGDEQGARLHELIGMEEIAHVAFAAHWFRAFEGELTFRTWLDRLPLPLSPMVMRGRPLHHAARREAGLDLPFLEELEAWQPELRGS